MGEWGVCVTEGNGGDVHVGGLLDGLVICPGVSHDQEAGLLKLLLDLIGEGSCMSLSFRRSSFMCPEELLDLVLG